MAKDLGKNLDIWKDRTLFDVTEESNLRIIVSPHQKRKKKLKRSLEKHNEHIKTCRRIFQKTVTLLNVEKVPHVQDDLIDQMLEIKPTEKASNHVLFAL